MPLRENTYSRSEEEIPFYIKRHNFNVPKSRVREDGIVKILWSEYAAFRRDVLCYIKKLLPQKPSVIYDPMAGTAPLIPFIENQGHTGYFNDILPLHYFTNKAKTYRVCECFRKYGYSWFLKELLHCMASLRDQHLCVSEKWIDDRVLRGLTHAWRAAEVYDKNVEIFFKAVILRCVRPLSSYTKSRNPTWLKFGGTSTNRSLREIVEDCLNIFQKYYDNSYESFTNTRRGNSKFYSQNAAKLLLKTKADIIVTSPPYCNRLEYSVQYGPENYFLSKVGHSISSTVLAGTTKVRDYKTFSEDFENIASSSEYGRRLLEKIKKSPYHDDQSYYLKYYTRYFANIYRIFNQVINNLSPKGKMYIVVQDNGHRGELIEIDRVLREFLKKKTYRSRVIKKWEVHHLGLRNISKDHAFVRRKQFEKVLIVEK